jgi:hypothetical protein
VAARKGAGPPDLLNQGARKERAFRTRTPSTSSPHPCQAAVVIRQLEILAAHGFDLADRVAVGILPFNLAVDLAYEAAIWGDLPDAVDGSGLIDASRAGAPTGDGIVRVIIAAAFASARRPA